MTMFFNSCQINGLYESLRLLPNLPNLL